MAGVLGSFSFILMNSAVRVWSGAKVGLDVPQTTELMTILKEAGLPVQADIIDEQECVAALKALLTR